MKEKEVESDILRNILLKTRIIKALNVKLCDNTELYRLSTIE